MARVCKFHQSVLHRLLLFNLLCAHLPSREQVSRCSQKLLTGRGFLKIHKSQPSVFQCKWVLERSYSRWRDNPCSRWPSSSALWCAQGRLLDLPSYWRTLLFLKLSILRGSGQKNVRKYFGSICPSTTKDLMVFNFTFHSEVGSLCILIP